MTRGAERPGARVDFLSEGRARVGDVGILRVSIDAAVVALTQRLSAHGAQPLVLGFVNAYSIALSNRQEAYRRLLQSPSRLNFADGTPVAWLCAAGFPLKKYHVRGPSFFERALEVGVSENVRHYFLGGSPELLETLTTRVVKKFPGLVVAGSFSPPFRDLTDLERAAQDQDIRDAAPDIVWVGLGTPKQDFEAERLVRDVGVHAAAVGAAFDFVSGMKPEAPKVMRRLGLEWVFRLGSEPRRLWRRYLIGNFEFAYAVVKNAGRGRL